MIMAVKHRKIYKLYKLLSKSPNITEAKLSEKN